MAMADWEAFDDEALLAGRGDWLDPAQLAALAAHPLACIDTEYPHFVHSSEGPEDHEPPAERHPVFYGCFDWHSAVHSHWCLLRQRRLFAAHPEADAIDERLAERFTPEAVAAEVAFFESNETFERPYGWGWFLRLIAELSLWDDDRGAAWRETLRPLEERIVTLVETEFLTMDRPHRVGTHGNSAFALAGVLDYARVTEHGDLEAAVTRTARAFYLDDRDYPVGYEPLGWDFLSPGLAEADLMRRVLDPDRFADWFDGFWPTEAPSPDGVLEPVAVDPSDGAALHLVGLNLSRAWCLAGLAETLAPHQKGGTFRRSAVRHAERGLAEAFTDDYAGAHWLSSFVLYLLTRNAGGIAPA